jgi:TolA-binding protein
MTNRPPDTPRSADYVGRVEKACTRLAADGEPITADAVAALAGIGRATLYRRPELRALIEEHRQQARESLTLTGLAVQIDQLRDSLEAVAGNVRRHEEQLRRMNKQQRNT